MNAKTLIAGLFATVAATGAFAQEFNGEAFYQKPQLSASNVTRAQVKAELAQAISSHQIIVGDAGYKIEQSPSTLTRAEVKSELARAIANDEIIVGDAGFKFQSTPSTLSRAQVGAEVTKAEAAGTLLRSEG